jgi:hypothetical protein
MREMGLGRSLPIVGRELARDSDMEIACKQASYIDQLMASFSTSEAGVIA